MNKGGGLEYVKVGDGGEGRVGAFASARRHGSDLGRSTHYRCHAAPGAAAG